MKNLQRPTYSFLVLVIGLIIINTILARAAVLISPAGATGVAWGYFAIAFMIVFTLWFGAYGAIAAYVGGFLGAGILSGISPEVSLYWSLSNLWQVLIPLVAFRVFEANVGIENRRDLFHLILFGVILNNVVGAAWGSITMAIGSVIEPSQIMSVFTPWMLGNMIITIIIVLPVLHYYTPSIRKSKVFVRNYWD
jgi:hypothetical protein